VQKSREVVDGKGVGSVPFSHPSKLGVKKSGEVDEKTGIDVDEAGERDPSSRKGIRDVP
jgi:hypothetical protein